MKLIPKKPLALMRCMLLLLAIGSKGCEIYTYRPTRVFVVDGETGAPIPGAKVIARGFGASIIDFTPPKTGKAITDADGTAVVRTAVAYSLLWEVTASGYLPEERWAGVDPRYWTDEGFGLFREPEPQINILIPKGYRGPLALQISPVNDAGQYPPGQREFDFPVNERGVVRIVQTPLLQRVDRFMFRVVEKQGQTLYRAGPVTLLPDAVGVRHVHTDGERELLVVGTAAEATAIRLRVGVFSPDGSADNVINQAEFNSFFDPPASEARKGG